MSKQAETGHVGHGGHLWKTGEMLTGPVQLHHQVAGHVSIGCVQHAFLFCRDVDTDTQWLGQVQSTACGCRIVALELSLVHLTGDGKAENWLGCVNRMAAGQGNAGGIAGDATATNHLGGNLRGQNIDRPAQNGNGQQWCAAHGINITDGVGGGDPAEIKGIVDNRHEKIGGGNDTTLVIQGIDGSIIAGLVAHPQAWIQLLVAAASKDGAEDAGSNLATATSTVAVLRETDGFGHVRLAWQKGNCTPVTSRCTGILRMHGTSFPRSMYASVSLQAVK